MKHIDVYLFITHTAQVNELSFDSIKQYMFDKLQLDWTQEDQDRFLSNIVKPKTHHIVEALQQQGYTTKYICEYLQITRQSVANALQKAKLETSREYINAFLIQKINWTLQEKLNQRP